MITDADIVLIVTRLWPGYFMQWLPAGWQSVGPMRDKAVGPSPVPGVTLATVGYRVLSRDEWEVPLTPGETDPVYGGGELFAFSIGLPSGGVGNVVEDSNGRSGV